MHAWHLGTVKPWQLPGLQWLGWAVEPWLTGSSVSGCCGGQCWGCCWRSTDGAWTLTPSSPGHIQDKMISWVQLLAGAAARGCFTNHALLKVRLGQDYCLNIFFPISQAGFPSLYVVANFLFPGPLSLGQKMCSLEPFCLALSLRVGKSYSWQTSLHIILLSWVCQQQLKLVLFRTFVARAPRSWVGRYRYCFLWKPNPNRNDTKNWGLWLFCVYFSVICADQPPQYLVVFVFIFTWTQWWCF